MVSAGFDGSGTLVTSTREKALELMRAASNSRPPSPELPANWAPSIDISE